MIHSVGKIDLYSYLRPIVKELLKLQKRPLRVCFNGQLVATSSITLTYTLGDGSEIIKLMSHGGHMSTYGCRFCLTKGERRKDIVDTTVAGRGGIYFPHRGKTMRSYESLIHTETEEHYVS